MRQDISPWAADYAVAPSLFLDFTSEYEGRRTVTRVGANPPPEFWKYAGVAFGVTAVVAAVGLAAHYANRSDRH